MNCEKDVREWVEYAEADRLSAQNAFNAADYRDVAFHCHQIIEKLLKAAIVAQTGRRPPYAHNLWKLAQAVKGLTIPAEIADKMASINPHYIISRYPTGMRTGYTRELAAELLQEDARGVPMAYGKVELTQRLRRYLAVLQENIPIQKAILYGSYAYGNPHDWSDIDLVVLSPAFRGVPYPKRLERLAVLAWRAGVGDIEALGYTPEEFESASHLSLLGEVRERGIVVYSEESGKGQTES